MCDYSLHNVKSRPAKVGDKLTTRDFGTGTRGFSASEDESLVVCVRPGTELSFAEEVTFSATGLAGWWRKVINHKTAIFRQVNKERVVGHHDALEFPDGRIVLWWLVWTVIRCVKGLLALNMGEAIRYPNSWWFGEP
jgi:hypothetical protein